MAGGGDTNVAIAVVKSVRNTGVTYANYSQTNTLALSGNHYSAMSNDGNWIATKVRGSGSWILNLWSRSGSAWTNVSTLTVTDIATFGPGITWDPSNTYVAIPAGKTIDASTARPVFIAKRVSSAWAAQTTITIPGSYPTTGVMAADLAAWSPDGSVLTIWYQNATTTTNSLTRYSRSGDTFTLLPGLLFGEIPGADSLVYGFGFSAIGDKALVSWKSSSNVTRTYVYSISGTTWTRTDPGSTVAERASDITWSPDGATVFGAAATGGVRTWAVSGSTYTRQAISAASTTSGFYCDTAYYASAANILQQTQGANPTWTITNNINGGFTSSQTMASGSKKSVPGSK